MNRSLLVLGIVFMLAGFFFLNQGVRVLAPVAQLAGLASQVQTEEPVLPPTLLTVPALNYNFLPADLQGGVSVKGTLQVSNGQEIAMYVMDQENFAQWQTRHTGAVLLAELLAISCNFTITPKVAGTYYFIFDNQDTTKRVVILSLSVIENSIVVSPLIEDAGYGVFALGILFFVVGARIGKKKPKHQEPQKTTAPGTGCRFCGAQLASGQVFCAKCRRAQK